MKFKGSTLFSKVFKSRQKYEADVKVLEDYLRDKIDFEFAIDWQPSDGHMILDVDSGMKIATVSMCLAVILKKGKLSREDHNALCI